MALEKAIPIPHTPYTLDYHRVGQVRYAPKESIRITIFSYPDKATRDSGAEPARTDMRVVVPLVDRPLVEVVETDKNGEPIVDESGTEKTKMVAGDPVYLESQLTPDTMTGQAYQILKSTENWKDARDV